MDEETSIAWIDMLNLMLQGLVLAVAFALILMNPPAKDAPDDPTVKGTVTIQLFWPPELDTDVDLWVRNPKKEIVGYSHKNAPSMDLLRDDLGFFNDVSGVNFELVSARVVLPGEWVVNAHWYSRKDPSIQEVPVHVSIYVRANGEYTLIAEVKAFLTRTGEELTLVRFRLDEQGHLVPGSVNNLPMGLRSMPQ